MKRLLLTYIYLLFVSLAIIGQVNQVWWSKGRVLHVNPVAGIDSVTFGQFVNADTFLIVIDRASRRIVYDTIDEHVPGMVFHDTIHTTHTVYLNPGRRIGVFSVAKDRQVSFSQGNLQYVRNQDVWKFADQQYEYIGARNVKDGVLANRIDLFGWSGKDSKFPFGVGSSTKYTEYKGDFVDWGVNEINVDKPNTWRTLSVEEWEYIYYGRQNAQKLIALGTVNGVQGLILLPDNWQLPEGIAFVPSVEMGLQWQADRLEGSYFDSSNKDHTKDNIYTKEQWQKMEGAGAVFLPCAGWRVGIDWRKDYASAYEGIKTSYLGSYWTNSSLQNNSSYYFFRFAQQEIRKYPFLSDLSLMARGRAVRLVHDTIVPKPQPEYVDLGLSVKWATFNIGASAPEENGDYFAWGETEPKVEYSWENYKWCDGGYTSLTKYCSDDTLCIDGFTDGLTQLVLEDDVAHVNWGGNWRMPTNAEMTELRNKCTWTYCTMNDINGYKVVGPNGNSIFLPIAGFYSGSTLHRNDLGAYWTKSLNVEKQQSALGLYMDANRYSVYYNSNRQNGFLIRPVYDGPKPSKRIGVFSVAKDKQVSFSQGNLQYIQSQDKWQFANTQYEYMGNRHFVNGQLADTIEYFGWSGKNSNAPWGISLSIELKDYEGEFLDWGTNVISGDVPNTWRTLSNDELIYLCQKRENASQLLGLGYIGAISGLIILPDDWVTPEGLQFTPNTNDASLNQYTKEQWAIMENVGAVFIPATGYFNHKLDNMRGVNEKGYYRVSTLAEDGRQMYLVYGKDHITYSYSGNNNGNLFYAFPVRLVHDTIVPPPAPCETFEVNGIEFNMMCVEGGTFMMGASDDDTNAEADEKPQHKVTLSDYYIGQTEVIQQLWQAVMGYNPSSLKGDNLPVESVSWDECQQFVEKLSEMTGLYFRLPTEAEWEYAARGGNRSKGYVYAGSNNADSVAWHPNNCSELQPVGQKTPNELGLYDMSGNLYEWCSDWYGAYSSEPQINPQGTTSSHDNYHIARGGCWQSQKGGKDDIYYCGVTNRGYAKNASVQIGLRIVLDERPVLPPMLEYVDLGLSVKWATFNLGASAPEDYGDYFAWGEVELKEEYSWGNYKWCDGTESVMTKYNDVDNKSILDEEDDAAKVNWGGDWRMPTDEELTELREKCTWEWTTLNGVNGYKVIGVNGNSIFLPTAGYYLNIPKGCNVEGCYWTKSKTFNKYSCGLYLNSGVQEIRNSSRLRGHTIRPVYDDIKVSKRIEELGGKR